VFAFTESIRIQATPGAVWEVLADVEQWWRASNPGHLHIEVQPPGEPVGPGSGIVIAERIAGIRGKAAGSLTRWTPEREAAWEGTAVYRDCGMPVRIRQGVCWRIGDRGRSSKLSAHVWAAFPPTLTGRILEWYMKTVLKAVERDREHTPRELEYLKAAIEGAS
jgi:hypothetical protein